MSETHAKILLRMPAEDRKALKILAAEQNTNMTEIICRLIRQHLADQHARQDA